MLVDAELMKILACPKCHHGLEEKASASQLVCPACRLAYPVRDGIPVMLIEEAVRLS